MRPLIGITVGQIRHAQHLWEPTVYGQSHTYSDAIIRAGGTPYLIPLTEDLVVLQDIYGRLNGILFSGGNDISPVLYGQHPYPTTHEVHQLRDSTELLLMKWALSDKKPILGICRGMQLLNIVGGGTLYQDIEKDLPKMDDHITSITKKDFNYLAHRIKIKDSSRLAKIMEATTISANSLHHQSIKKKATNLEAVAWSEDGLIEAVEGKGGSYIIGIQCHPESLEEQTVPEYQKLFKSFVLATN